MIEQELLYIVKLFCNPTPVRKNSFFRTMSDISAKLGIKMADVVSHADAIMAKREGHYACGKDRFLNFRASCLVQEMHPTPANMAREAKRFAMKHIAYLWAVEKGQETSYGELIESLADIFNYRRLIRKIMGWEQ